MIKNKVRNRTANNLIKFNTTTDISTTTRMPKTNPIKYLRITKPMKFHIKIRKDKYSNLAK